MHYKRPESVLVVIYNDRHQVLVMQRNDDANFWQSVTGTIEAGETPLATAYREVAEETGIVLAPDSGRIIDCQQTNQYEIRPEWQYRYPPGKTINTEYVFRLQVANDTPITLSEHSAYHWLSIEAAQKKVWSPSNQAAIACLAEV